jgi:hypothetical protein
MNKIRFVNAKKPNLDNNLPQKKEGLHDSI